jgi:hypothetical protein
VHSDDAPTVYLNGHPGPTSPLTRALEHDLATLVAFDPVTSSTPLLMRRMADPTEMALLHMITHDPARTPTLTYFANDDFFITAATSVTACTPLSACSKEQPGFNWNHGDFQRSITHTWLALVGPHVRTLGESGAIFSDHTDVRPTLMQLTQLRDDYAHDGRVLVEVLDAPDAQHDTLSRLGAAYKAINAPLGELARRTLMISTRALSGDDATYSALEAQIASLTTQRNAIAGRMIALIEAAEFEHASIDEHEANELIEAAYGLIAAQSPAAQ